MTDEAYYWHRGDVPSRTYVQPFVGYEEPETKRRFENLVRLSGLGQVLDPISPRVIGTDDLARFHDLEHVRRVQHLSDTEGGSVGDFAYVWPGGYEIAALSVGGVYAAVERVVSGSCNNAYALVRPPGHHAERDRGRGYCIFNNVAVAVLTARSQLGLGRVAIVDWDVHHGNGTEQAFLHDPNVLTISLHQDRNYPVDSGGIVQPGTGAGTTINIPLPAGSGSGAYLRAFEGLVLPAIRSFSPELILVSSGFDAGALDPLGRMMLTADTFGLLMQLLVQAAADFCDGRLVAAHEGGYSAPHVPFCGLRVLEAMSGCDAEIPDPYAWVGDYGGQELQPHQEAMITEATSAWEVNRSTTSE